MRKRKEVDKDLLEIYIDNKFVISKDNNKWFFEYGGEITNDIAEAVVILMKDFKSDHFIWNTELGDIEIDDVTPEKSLFWLSGGYNEWINLEHYKQPWFECYLDFQEEFGFLIINIVNESNTMGDIRNKFIKYLNLPILYDFALSKNLIK